MHGLEDYNAGLLEQIAGSGTPSPAQALDPHAAAVFDPAISDPGPFTTDIAILGHDGGSNFTLTIQRTGKTGPNKDSICVLLLLSDVTI
jgi:hypothetical protein